MNAAFTQSGDRLAFDADGHPTPAVDFAFDEVDARLAGTPEANDGEALGGDRGEAVRRLLVWLTAGRDVADAGRRAVLLGTVLALPGCPRTCRALGRRLAVSHEQARRLLTRIRAELAGNPRFSEQSVDTDHIVDDDN